MLGGNRPGSEGNLASDDNDDSARPVAPHPPETEAKPGENQQEKSEKKMERIDKPAEKSDKPTDKSDKPQEAKSQDGNRAQEPKADSKPDANPQGETAPAEDKQEGGNQFRPFNL